MSVILGKNKKSQMLRNFTKSIGNKMLKNFQQNYDRVKIFKSFLKTNFLKYSAKDLLHQQICIYVRLIDIGLEWSNYHLGIRISF